MRSPASIIQEHYGLARRVTPEEVRAELANLRRRMARDGDIADDNLRRLYYRLYFYLRED